MVRKWYIMAGHSHEIQCDNQKRVGNDQEQLDIVMKCCKQLKMTGKHLQILKNGTKGLKWLQNDPEMMKNGQATIINPFIYRVNRTMKPL